MNFDLIHEVKFLYRKNKKAKLCNMKDKKAQLCNMEDEKVKLCNMKDKKTQLWNKKDDKTNLWTSVVMTGIMFVALFLGEVTVSASTDYIEVSSPDEMIDVLAEDGDIITDQEAESDSAYALKRVILLGVDDTEDDLYASLGASSVISYPEYEEIILSFDTEAETKTAYKKLLTIYGSDKCFLDEVIHADDMIFEGDTSTESDERDGDVSMESDERDGDASTESDERDGDVSTEIDLYADEDNTASTNYTATSWGVSAMGMDQLKSSYTADFTNDVTVAVLDTGINRDNAMFSGRTITGCNIMTNSNDNSDIVTDLKGHGTHVCGIISDATPANVDLMVIGVFDADGTSTHSVLYTAFQYALEHGADVINISAGYHSTTLTFLDKIIDDCYQEGVPIVAAAGNKEEDISSVYPASNTETITVSGLKQESGVPYSLSFDSTYSNYGNLTDFSAPGTNIESAANTSGTAFAMKKGTSMAAPHITAAFAWLKLFYPEESVPELYSRLTGYSVDLGATGKDIYYGNGCPVLGTLLTDVGYVAKETSVTTETTTQTESQTTGTATKNPGTTTQTAGSTTQSSGTTTQTAGSTTQSAGTTTKTNGTTTQKAGDTSKTTSTSATSKTSQKAKSSAVVKVQKTKITYAKRKCIRSIRLRWKKVSGVTGYQICYSNSRYFRKGNHYITVKGSGKSNRLIKKLHRHRTFYLRMRTYKVVKGKRIYSGWSNVKKVKTR